MRLDIGKAAPKGDGAPEIDLSLEMVKAGTAALRRMVAADEADPCVVTEIFYAMLAARTKPLLLDG